MLGNVVLACRIKARNLIPYPRLCTTSQVHTLPVQASQWTTFVDLLTWDRTEPSIRHCFSFIWANSLHACDICNGTSFLSSVWILIFCLVKSA